ncbi:MAG TPA: phosphoribosylformylglycinamidine synthase subunit PurS [Bryobacteraceae bacterium]|nr:phosphoribosylformylglycinamidine synthase subunit PurS [Bryobacteraceae bacterium]
MKARVYVSYKSTVLDPQGQTIQSALNGLGHKTITAVRQGKFFDIEIQAGTAREQAQQEMDKWRATCFPTLSWKTTAWRSSIDLHRKMTCVES